MREQQWAVQDSIQNDPDKKAGKSSLLVHRGDMKSAPKAKLKCGPEEVIHYSPVSTQSNGFKYRKRLNISF